MRARSILGGFAVTAVVALSHRPATDHRTAPFDSRTACAQVGADYFCNAVSGLSRSLRSPILSMNRAGILPPRETPGAINPDIDQGNIDTTICRPGYARSVQPPHSITGPLERRLMVAQHPGEPVADYELDHLIPISIGGAPLDMRDLWLEPRLGQANAGDKQVLANVLWHLVCEHRVPLATAQRDISRDWTSAYQTYATPENVARYHSRPPGDEQS